MPSPAAPITEGVIPLSGGHSLQLFGHGPQEQGDVEMDNRAQDQPSPPIIEHTAAVPQVVSITTPRVGRSTEGTTAASRPLPDDDVVMGNSLRGLVRDKGKARAPVADESSGEEFNNVITNDSDDKVRLAVPNP